MNSDQLILASGSPRRRQFFRELGLAFRVVAADIDETPRAGEHPGAMTCRLAEEKARAVAARLHAEAARPGVEAGRLDADAGRADADAGRLEADAARADADAGRADAEAARTGADAARAEADAGRAEADAGRAPAEAARAGAGAVLIVAADTTVALGDVIYGKPLDGEDARRMLRELRGRPHQVFSAVSVLRVPGERQATRINTTEVTMRDYGDDEIEAYVASGDPLDKAGAYGIQASEFNCAAHLQGCYAGVMGLPLADLTALLGEFGYAVPRDVQAVCKLFNPFGCCAAAPAHAVAITLG